MTHEHTGWGRNKTNDCPGCATEYHERRMAAMKRSIENIRIAEWMRKNASIFVEKFLRETDPTPENVDSPTE